MFQKGRGEGQGRGGKGRKRQRRGREEEGNGRESGKEGLVPHMTCLHDDPGAILGSAGWKTLAVGPGAKRHGVWRLFPQKIKQNVT